MYTHKREMKFITAQNMSATMDRRKIVRPSLCMLPSLPMYVPPVVVATIGCYVFAEEIRLINGFSTLMGFLNGAAVIPLHYSGLQTVHSHCSSSGAH